ncbi:MAG: hypothetical protein CSA07_01595 [Bacteroidia bacterium]|nr:MAG: hypothetical protein CSA07_01595 [Bacteroidia bacterium]
MAYAQDGDEQQTDKPQGSAVRLPTPRLQSLWQEYNRVRLAGSKKASNRLLLELIAGLRAEDEAHVEAFVHDLCSTLLASGFLANNGEEVSNAPLRLQHPLFREVVLPVLARKCQQKDALYLRWAAQLQQFFYSDWACAETLVRAIGGAPSSYDTLHLLERSYALQASEATLQLILEERARRLDYFSHEYPPTLLCTVELFRQEVAAFRDLLAERADSSQWSARLKGWEGMS